MGKQEVYRLDRTKRFRIWLARNCKRWPILLWASLVFGVVWGMQVGSQSATFVGVVEYPKYSVSAEQEGRISHISAEVGDRIRVGEPLVKIDNLRTEIALAELRERSERDARDAYRQFFAELAGVRREIRDLSLKRATEEAELIVLREESERLEALLERRLIDVETVSRNRIRLNVSETLVAEYPNLLAELEAEKQELITMRESYLVKDSPKRDRLESLLLEQRDALSLKANRSGLVARVLKREGDVVRSGETILELVEEKSPVVRAFLPLSSQQLVEEGDEVVMRFSGHGAQRVFGVVKSMSPTVIDVPDTSNPIMSRTISGRILTISLPSPTDWTEGQRLLVSLDTAEPSALRTLVANIFSKMRNGGGEI
ncbi:HlyD family secretion protein [Pelagicoccus mobilis]|uniref:HlyD family efflux transporter periplasmic adaptor subunit n=1 Tax=Pelagicoccus mobilis TaxID=415221 RepID=A0A934RT81_9BACT|nr:HlyD family efflux transporter periplasmic adaptor subunit [Pelagicoccus mobilis]MBK1875951.1 HlyD family efflux transporter periplasmic adaptor subunit [Pelagicoccus mobilis]